MTVPTTREEFKEYCLRKLGKPVISINIADSQIEDRIDEALQLFMHYHYDATEKVYYKHQITEQNKLDKYITLPENIMGAVNIFSFGDPSMRNNDIFSINYQIALNDLYTLTSVSMVPYFMTMQHLSLIQEMLVGKQQIRYNRMNNKLYVDADWKRFKADSFLVIEAYSVLDPNLVTKIWGDRWLQNYVTALLKKQWGDHLIKFPMTMPGGNRINGEAIMSEGIREVEKMENELKTNWTLPVDMMVG